jgi:hypothetical protein
MSKQQEKKNPLWLLIHLPAALLCYWVASRCMVGIHILTGNGFLSMAVFFISGFVFVWYIGMWVSAATELIVKKLFCNE